MGLKIIEQELEQNGNTKIDIDFHSVKNMVWFLEWLRFPRPLDFDGVYLMQVSGTIEGC